MTTTALTLMLATAAALIGGAGSPADQSTTLPPVVQRLLGEWTGTGTVTGRASSLTMTWDRAVGGAFITLKFRNDMSESATRPAEVFEAHGYYRLTNATTGAGTWFDSRGYALPVVVSIDADAFTSEWGTPELEMGRTRYRLTAAGVLEVTDWVRLADGTYREFGRSELRRR